MKPVNVLPNMVKGTLQRRLRILRWRDHPGLSGWANIITRIPKRGSESEKRNQQDQGLKCYDHEPKSAGNF